MPIYEYRALDKNGGCDRCASGFEQLQRLADSPLEACSDCGERLRRVISPPAVHASNALDPTNVARHGFTQYRRVRKGEYEKTAGRGPASIADDGKD